MLDKTSKYALLFTYSIYALAKGQGEIMPETREQIAARSSQLIQVVDDIFDLFEQANTLLCNWKPYYHTYFIEQLWKLKQLESELYTLGYDEDFVLTVKQAVYRSVLGD